MKLEHDAKTDNSIVRELTVAEKEQREVDVAKAAQRISEQQALIAAAKSARAKLAALGLTDDEINALLGA